MASDTIRVSGYLMQAIAHACINLSLFLDEATSAFINSLRGEQWYTLQQLNQLLDTVSKRYVDPAPILERIGIELVHNWRTHGPGAAMPAGHDSVEFLRYQTSSEAYYTIIKGAPEEIGAFSLTSMNQQAGHATVHSTTPFSKDMERGILMGSFLSLHDYDYINVDNSADPHIFEIEFH